jgi:integrase
MALHLIKSKKQIDDLKPGAATLYDGGGLCLLPAKKVGGHPGWRFNYTFQKLRKTISFGTYPQVDLEKAREHAQKATELLAKGLDPSAERKRESAAIVAQREADKLVAAGLPAKGTFEEVARRWYETKYSGWVDGYGSKVIRRLEIHVFPFVGHRPIHEIEPAELLETCRRIEKQGTLETAHRALEHCSRVFRFAVAESLLKTDPCRDLRGALKAPVSTHFAAITEPRQLAQLLRDMYAYNGTYVVRCALRLAPMLFLRPGELRQARWEEFDLDNGIWYVPSVRMKRTKQQKATGQPHFVSLPRQAVALLEDLFLLTGRTGFVFPAEGRTGRTMSENTVNMALRAMGYTSSVVTGHGFRATARTLIAEALEIAPAVMELQLAHAVKDENGEAYNRTEFIDRRRAMMQEQKPLVQIYSGPTAWAAGR